LEQGQVLVWALKQVLASQALVQALASGLTSGQVLASEQGLASGQALA